MVKRYLYRFGATFAMVAPALGAYHSVAAQTIDDTINATTGLALANEIVEPLWDVITAFAPVVVKYTFILMAVGALIFAIVGGVKRLMRVA